MKTCNTWMFDGWYDASANKCRMCKGAKNAMSYTVDLGYCVPVSQEMLGPYDLLEEVPVDQRKPCDPSKNPDCKSNGCWQEYHELVNGQCMGPCSESMGVFRDPTNLRTCIRDVSSSNIRIEDPWECPPHEIPFNGNCKYLGDLPPRGLVKNTQPSGSRKVSETDDGSKMQPPFVFLVTGLCVALLILLLFLVFRK